LDFLLIVRDQLKTAPIVSLSAERVPLESPALAGLSFMRPAKAGKHLT
jgi:hypothetical protein